MGGTVLWWSAFKIVSDSLALLSWWLQLLKIYISLIVNCCFIRSQNMFNFITATMSSSTYIPNFSVKFVFQPIYTNYGYFEEKKITLKVKFKTRWPILASWKSLVFNFFELETYFGAIKRVYWLQGYANALLISGLWKGFTDFRVMQMLYWFQGYENALLTQGYENALLISGLWKCFTKGDG